MEKINDVNQEVCLGHQWHYLPVINFGGFEIHRKCNYCEKSEKRYVPDYKLPGIWHFFMTWEDKQHEKNETK